MTMIKTKAFAASRVAFDFFGSADTKVQTKSDRDWAARLAFVSLVIYGLAVLVEIVSQFNLAG